MRKDKHRVVGTSVAVNPCCRHFSVISEKRHVLFSLEWHRLIVAVSCVLILGLWLQPVSSAREELVSPDGGRRFRSFVTAKKYLKKIYSNSRQTFYCGCPMAYPYAHVKRCGVWQNYSFREVPHPVEFEHVYPMHRFKERLLPLLGPQMKEKCPTLSRRCLRKYFRIFSYFESDMFHIRPVLKKLNRLRGVKWFAFLQSSPSLLPPVGLRRRPSYRCEISFQNQRATMPASIRGDISRMMLYLAQTYSSYNLFTAQEMTLFQQWSVRDPVTAQERDVVRKIAEYQQMSVPHVYARHERDTPYVPGLERMK